MGGFLTGLRKTFVRGILLILPLAITYLIMRWLFSLVTGFTSPMVEGLLARLPFPAGGMGLVGFFAPLIGVLISVGVVLLVGLVGGNFLGKRILFQFEALMLRIPLVRWFYGSARQMIEAFRASGGGAFKEVVLVEYPRRGIWVVGFVTAAADGEVPGAEGRDCVFVYLPTTPNPTSGYTVVIPRSDLSPINMTVDEGLKLIVSGGFVAPPLRMIGGRDAPGSVRA